jgi:hypothetical protein
MEIKLMSESLTKEAFQRNLNTKFRVSLEAGRSVAVELFELVEGNSTSTQEQFSLTFRGPLETPFDQGMRDVEHDTMGSFVLFFVPIARNSDGMIYEAVFNRVIKQESKI